MYDVAVVGGGMAGYTAALRAAQLGGRVVLVEEGDPGGTCLNRGCIPARAWLSTVSLLLDFRRASALGVRVGECRLEPGIAAGRVRSVVDRLRSAIERSLKEAGVVQVRGHARLLPADGRGHRLAVTPAPPGVRSSLVRSSGGSGSQTPGEGEGRLVPLEREIIAARAVILATGSRPWYPQLPGLERPDGEVPGPYGGEGQLPGPYGGERQMPGVVSADEVLYPRGTRFPALARGEVPGRLVVLGGGVIGVEMAFLYAVLGARVTLVEIEERLLPQLDGEIGDLVRALLEGEGVEILTASRVKSLTGAGTRPNGAGCLVAVNTPAGERVLETDAVLVATGRRPRLEAVEKVPEVRLENGWVWTDDHQRTSVPGLFAAGDVTGRMLLAQVAARQGAVAAENALGGDARMDYRVVPACLYTRSEVAWVGLSAREAAARGYAVVVGRASMGGNPRALAAGEEEGWVEVVADGRYGEILGAHLVGPHAGELVSQVAGMMQAEATILEWEKVIHPHPTLSEAIGEAVAIAAHQMRAGAGR